MGQTPLDPQAKAVGAVALTVLVNICYGNPRAVHVLMRNVDTRELIKGLVSMKVRVIHYSFFEFIPPYVNTFMPLVNKLS